MKSRVIQRKTNVDTSELSSMYNQIIGNEDGDPDIITKKYTDLISKINYYNKLLISLAKSDNFLIKTFPEISESMTEIRNYVDRFRNAIPQINDEDFKISILETDTLEERFEKSRQQNINMNEFIINNYKKFKDSDEIKSIIILGGTLNNYKAFIGEENNLNNKFIRDYVGASFIIFPFSTFNIKFIYNNEIMSQSKVNIENTPGYNIDKYLLLIFHKLYNVCKDIHKIIISPDIDAKKFGKTLIDALSELKNQIPRCGDAFKIIENSIGLFENNFDNYYKDFVLSKNPNIIMENFITDIAEQHSSTPVVAAQFKEIIKFFNKMMMQSGHKNDPVMTELFDKLNINFKLFE